jgi:hypothetical protein
MARSSIQDSMRRRVVEHWHAAIRWLAVAVLTLAVHLASLLLLGFPLTFRVTGLRVVLVPTVIAFAWLLRRVLGLAFAAHAASRGAPNARARGR